MFGIDDIISAILGVAKDAAPLAVKQMQRQKLFINLLKKLKLDPDCPPTDFAGVYQYALVEYGANKLGILGEEELALVLELLRQKETQAAFREAFAADDRAIIFKKVEKYIDEYALKDEIGDRRIDRRIDRPIDSRIDSPIDCLHYLAEFRTYFIAIVKRTRTPAEIMGNFQFQNLQENILKPQETLASPDSTAGVIGQDLVFVRQLHAWFEALYDLEGDGVWREDYFEWTIRVPARRRYDRVLVLGIQGEANIKDLDALRQSVAARNTDEGWLVASSPISPAVRAALRGDRQLFCYTFDELIDEAADFSGYLDWLEAEVKRQKIDSLYVPLACTKEEIDPKTKLTLGKSRYDERNGWIDRYINRWLDDPAQEHLSILGEFGTGKTWFVLHYAWQAVQEYRAAKAEGRPLPRLPLVIPLRDYAKAVTIESLLSEFFFHKHHVGLPNYKAFEILNRMGKLLLIFDGFDEMAAKVDRQLTIDNFWELAKVVVPGSKAILTCRTEHFPDPRKGGEIMSAGRKAQSAMAIGEMPQFDVLKLEQFNNEQVRALLSKRAEPETTAKIMANPQLLNLARRPVMANLILAALPDVESGLPVDLARIYLYALRRQMERDVTSDRTFHSISDKLYFLCELAWEMLSKNQMSLNYSDLSDRIRSLFGSAVQEQKGLDSCHYDIMAQTLLVRNANGDYSPVSRSLLEFFVAYKFTAQLGILAPDFAEVAAISFADNLRETFGQAPLTKAVLDLLLPMLDPGAATGERLLDLIASTKGKTPAEVGYLGGNAATLLLKANPISQHRDISETKVWGDNFTRASLPRVNCADANLSESLFAKTFDSILSRAFSPDGKLLGAGRSNREVRLYQVADRKELATYRGHTDSVSSLAESSIAESSLAESSLAEDSIAESSIAESSIAELANSQRQLAANLVGEKGWDIGSVDSLQIIPFHSNGHSNGHSNLSSNYRSNAAFSVAYSADGKTLAFGSDDYTIKLWDIGSTDSSQSCRMRSNSKINGRSHSNNHSNGRSNSHSNGRSKDSRSSAFSVAYSADGKTLAFGSDDYTIKLWDIGSSRLES